MKLHLLVPTIAAGAALALGAAGTAAAATAGTWTAYPGQATISQTAVQQPINADGSSNFKGNGKAVIPVKFSLSQGLGAFVFESIGSDTNAANDSSFLTFTPSAAMTFNDVTNLASNYAFTVGDCHGGSLRWSVRVSETQSVFIYYGTPPQFGAGGVGGCTGADSQSLVNLMQQTDLRFDTSQLTGGTFYDTLAHAQQLVGTTPILRASLVLDSGWGGDQRLTLSSATVNDNTFTPPAASAPAPTCSLPPATIKITKTSDSASGAVNEPATIQPNDNDANFRVVDCKYMYNLATSSLSGAGSYKVEVVIGGVPLAGAATFDLR